MKKIKKSKMFKNTIIITLYLITTEIFFRYISGIKVFELSLIRMALGCLFTSIVFSFLISWFNDKIKRTFNIILAFSFSIYSFLQLGFNNFLGVYISVNTSSQLNAVTDYIREFLASFLMKFYLIFIPFILFLIYQIFIDRFLCKNNNGKKFILKKNSQYEYQVRFLMTLISLIMCAIVYYQTLTVDFMQNSLQPISNKDLF